MSTTTTTSNGTAKARPATPPAAPAIPAGEEFAKLSLAERRALLSGGPLTRADKATTTVVLYHDGRIHKGTLAGHGPADRAEYLKWLDTAPAVSVSAPAPGAGTYGDPETGKAKPAATKKGVSPGHDCTPFLASEMLPVS
jgi:hypothetical protein